MRKSFERGLQKNKFNSLIEPLRTDWKNSDHCDNVRLFYEFSLVLEDFTSNLN